MSNCFNPANILLPNDGIDMENGQLSPVTSSQVRLIIGMLWKSMWAMLRQHLMWCFPKYIWEQLRIGRMIAIRQGMVSKMTKKPAGKQNMLQ